MPALDTRSPGFVSSLWSCLEYHFKNLGPPVPDIWRDDTGIRPSDDFDEAIQAAIKDADILLIVLSNNWLSRQWCRQELDLFQQRWGDRTKRHVFLIKKSQVEFGQLPPLLQNIKGAIFYDEDERGPQRQREFFDYTCGRPFEQFKSQYHSTIERLANDLRDRAKAPDDSVAASPSTAPQSDSARKIFVAKPAGDMRDAYDRIVIELQKRGYGVVPGADEKIPLESVSAATEFVKAALKNAESSIHLLGRNMGNAPDGDDPEPIAKLQLRLAGERAASAKKEDSFWRFIWAPKFIVSADAEAQDAKGRDPFEVLQKFGEDRKRIGDNDKLEDAECSTFVEMFLGYLDRKPPALGPETAGIDADSTVYLHFRRDDIDYATKVAAALDKRRVKAVKPTFSADSGTELDASNKRKLATCDAVVLCWGNVPETWIEQQPGIWSNYRSLGREKDFERKSLLAGPPGDNPDKDWAATRQSYEGVDMVLDLRKFKDGEVPPEALDPLFAKTPAIKKRRA